MKYARVLYNDEPIWGVIEGKYVRLIDSAPFEQWEYLGSEVRSARACFQAPVTGHLAYWHEGKGARLKSSASVSVINGVVTCPPTGMDCLYGVAAIVDANGALFGCTQFICGSLGPVIFREDFENDAKLKVHVNGVLLADKAVNVVLHDLAEALGELKKAFPLEAGDTAALVFEAGKLYTGDRLTISFDGAGDFKLLVTEK